MNKPTTTSKKLDITLCAPPLNVFNIQVQYVNLSPFKMQLQTLKMLQSPKVGDDHLTSYPCEITTNII